MRDDILDRVVKNFNREPRKEIAKLNLAELNARLMKFKNQLQGDKFRDAKLLEVVDVPLAILEELDKQVGDISEADVNNVTFWQE